jgi:hypothetical protein
VSTHHHSVLFYFLGLIISLQDNTARQVMSNAAVQAGIPVDNLILALEPEGAVLSCLESETSAVCTMHYMLLF